MGEMRTTTDSRTVGSRAHESRSAHGDGPDDEITTVLARVRAERRPGAENATPRWQVRIGWSGCADWPPFTFDAKDTREDAEYCARNAMTWKRSGDGLHVTGAWVRAPGASEWTTLALPAQQGSALASVDA
jgi:hypothetical protein